VEVFFDITTALLISLDYLIIIYYNKIEITGKLRRLALSEHLNYESIGLIIGERSGALWKI
jgi:hypothetical protein